MIISLGGPISRHLKQLYIPHLANSVCRGLSSYYTYPIDTNFQICAGGPNQDFCDVSLVIIQNVRWNYYV